MDGGGALHGIGGGGESGRARVARAIRIGLETGLVGMKEAMGYILVEAEMRGG